MPAHRVSVLTLAGLLMSVLVACGASGSAAQETAVPADDPAGITLRIGVLSITGSLRQAIHIEAGSFEDTPYEIEWIEFSGSSEAVEALNAGAIDMAMAMQSSVLVLAQGNAREPWTDESAPFIVVGAETPVDDPGFVLLVHPDAGIDEVGDLRGRKVAYARGATGHYFFARLARDAGLGRDDFEEVLMTAGEGRAAFTSGAVDAVLTSYRNALPLVSSGDATILAVSGDTITMYSLTFVRSDLLDSPATDAAVRDVLERMERTQEWSVANPDSLASIYEREAHMSPDDARTAAELDPRRRVPVDDEVLSALDDQVDVFLAEELIDDQIDMSIVLDQRYNDGASASS